MESRTHERAKHEFFEAQLRADATGLIASAAERSQRLGEEVDPIDCTKRATDIGDYLQALRQEVSKQQQAASEAPQQEAVEKDPRLAIFKADYDGDAALQAKIEWQVIEDRLLANNGHYLALAQAMEQGGVLFGVDQDGNPLIADRGDELIMKGMTYENARNRVLYKHTSNDKNGTIVLGKDSQPISTGYEMFPLIRIFNKSPEIIDYETHTGRPFVDPRIRNEDDSSCRGWGALPEDRDSSWLESGERPSLPYVIKFGSDGRGTCVALDNVKDDGLNHRGVRRLLRLKKT